MIKKALQWLIIIGVYAYSSQLAVEYQLGIFFFFRIVSREMFQNSTLR